MKKSTASASSSSTANPSKLIDQRISDLGDWRGEVLAKVRGIIRDSIPGVTEEWKWRGVPVWYHEGMLCTGESYKDHVKFTFAKGAALPDPQKQFTSSLEGNVRRGVDYYAGDKVNVKAITALVRAAAALNEESKKKKPKAKKA